MRLKTLVGVALVVCLALTALAQQDATQPPARFRTGVDVVQLDVTVLDEGRRPIRGLTVEDFTILENGQPQRIVALSAVDIPDRELPQASWMRDVPPDVRGNAIPEGRLMVIVMDDATMLPDPGILASARRVAKAVVDGLGPSDMAAVVFTLDNRHAQDFTTDRVRLLEAIDKLSVGPTGMPAGDEVFYRYSLETLTRTASLLSGIPRRRKAVVYVSVGVPIDIEQATTLVALSPDSGSRAPGDLQRALIDDVLQSDAPVTSARGEMFEQVQDTFQQALRSNVAIYAIDPAGLGGTSSYQQLRGGAIGGPRPTPDQAFAASEMRHDFLQTMSNNSGGFAVVNTNTPAAAVPRILAENGSYYILGYAPTNTAADGRFRRLEVKVNRPGAEVRARNGYYAPRASAASASRSVAAAPPTLADAMSGLLPRRDMPMQVAAAAFAGSDGAGTVAIVAALSQPAPNARATQEVELLTSAFHPDGKPAGSRRQNARLVLRPSEGPAQYEVLSQLDLKPGRYSLRIGAVNTALGLAASVHHDVEVPDFRRAEVSLSGLIVSMTPGPNVAPRDALAKLVPVVPTTWRTFIASDAVSTFARVYQGGRSPVGMVTVDVRITDISETRVFTASETLASTRFGADRAADFVMALPLEQLKPGDYLLTIEARLGLRSTARRDARFTVLALARRSLGVGGR